MAYPELFTALWPPATPTWALFLAAAFTLVALKNLLASKGKNLPPGPPNWPIIGALFELSNPIHLAMGRLARKYGPLVHMRVGSTPFVIISNAAYARDMLKNHDLEFASRPYTAGGYFFGFKFNAIGMSPYTPQWKLQRKICNENLFSAARFQSYEGIRSEEIVDTVHQVEAARKEGKPLAMKELFHSLNTNVMCRIAFSKRYAGPNVTLSKDMELFKSVTVKMTDLSGEVAIGNIFPALRALDAKFIIGRRMKPLGDQMMSLMDSICKDHEEQRALEAKQGVVLKEHEKDLLDVLLSLKGEERMSQLCIYGTMFDTLIGGTDTSTTTTDWAFSELLRNPHTMAKAQEEVLEVVGPDRRVQESDLAKLPYLEAIVKETLRLHPPVSIGVPHHNDAEASLGEYTIPARSTVFLNIYAIGRDPESWDRPDEFVPERFLRPENRAMQVWGQSYELLPFSAGRRKCPGSQFGWVMVQLTLAALLHAFDWSPPPGVKPENIDMEEHYGLVLLRANPVSALPTKLRLHSSIYAL